MLAEVDDFMLRTGDVWWLDQNDAYNSQLAYVNAAYNAIIKVDSTSYVPVQLFRVLLRRFVLIMHDSTVRNGIA
jgi:hypothetical protein